MKIKVYKEIKVCKHYATKPEIKIISDGTSKDFKNCFFLWIRKPNPYKSDEAYKMKSSTMGSQEPTDLQGMFLHRYYHKRETAIKNATIWYDKAMASWYRKQDRRQKLTVSALI